MERERERKRAGERESGRGSKQVTVGMTWHLLEEGHVGLDAAIGPGGEDQYAHRLQE